MNNLTINNARRYLRMVFWTGLAGYALGFCLAYAPSSLSWFIIASFYLCLFGLVAVPIALIGIAATEVWRRMTPKSLSAFSGVSANSHTKALGSMKAVTTFAWPILTGILVAFGAVVKFLVEGWFASSSESYEESDPSYNDYWRKTQGYPGYEVSGKIAEHDDQLF